MNGEKKKNTVEMYDLFLLLANRTLSNESKLSERACHLVVGKDNSGLFQLFFMDCANTELSHSTVEI